MLKSAFYRAAKRNDHRAAWKLLQQARAAGEADKFMIGMGLSLIHI